MFSHSNVSYEFTAAHTNYSHWNTPRGLWCISSDTRCEMAKSPGKCWTAFHTPHCLEECVCDVLWCSAVLFLDVPNWQTYFVLIHCPCQITVKLGKKAYGSAPENTVPNSREHSSLLYAIFPVQHFPLSLPCQSWIFPFSVNIKASNWLSLCGCVCACVWVCVCVCVGGGWQQHETPRELTVGRRIISWKGPWISLILLFLKRSMLDWCVHKHYGLKRPLPWPLNLYQSH